MSSDYIKRYQYEISRKFAWWKPRLSIKTNGRRDMMEFNCHLVVCKHIDMVSRICFELSINQ